jgi:hypothetical protein
MLLTIFLLLPPSTRCLVAGHVDLEDKRLVSEGIRKNPVSMLFLNAQNHTWFSIIQTKLKRVIHLTAPFPQLKKVTKSAPLFFLTLTQAF